MANTFKNATARNVGTSPVSVYTTPTLTQTTVIGCTVANITANNITVTVTLYDGVNTTNIVKDALVRNGSSMVVIGGDQKLVMQAGHQLRVTSSAANSADVVVSLLEIA